MATPWVTVSAAALNHTKAAAIVAALRSAAKAQGQSDPVDAMIADTVAEIRLALQSGGVHGDGEAADTVPPSLLRMACRLVIWEAKGRLEMDREFDEMDHREDLRRLALMREGKYAVETPESESGEMASGGSGAEVVQSRSRDATRQKLSGLL